MSLRMLVMVAALGVPVIGNAQVAVVVELVPDRTPPYVVGSSLSVDVWLQSQTSVDAWIQFVQFDFSDTDPSIVLSPTFSFDQSSLPKPPGAYKNHSDLPVPWTFFELACVCHEYRLPLPADGLLHIGSVGVSLPSDPGIYRLDLLNADEPNPILPKQGAMIYALLGVWTAADGEIEGGTLDFEVIPPPPIPTVSTWGTVGFSLLLLASAKSIIHHRANSQH